MSLRAKRIAAVAAILAAAGLATVAMYFATIYKPNVPETASGVAVASSAQLTSLSSALRGNDIPFIILDSRTVAIRPEDEAAVKKLIDSNPDKLDIDYAFTETAVPPPPPISTPSPEPSQPSLEPGAPTPSPSDTPSSASPAPTPAVPVDEEQPFPDNGDQWKPFTDPRVPAPGPDDPLPTEILDVYEMTPEDWAEAGWKNNTNLRAVARWQDVLVLSDAAALAKYEEWVELMFSTGQQKDASYLGQGTDQKVLMSPFVLPQPVLTSLKNYIGSQNITVLGNQPTINFQWTSRMSLDAANKFLAAAPVRLLAQQQSDGSIVFRYVGLFLSEEQFIELGRTYRAAGGSPATLMPSG